MPPLPSWHETSYDVDVGVARIRQGRDVDRDLLYVGIDVDLGVVCREDRDLDEHVLLADPDDPSWGRACGVTLGSPRGPLPEIIREAHAALVKVLGRIEVSDRKVAEAIGKP